MSIAFLLFSTISSVQAVPLQLTQQGRILDSAGASITGLQDITFRIFDSSANGTQLWSEAISVNFSNGYYAAVLGSDEQNNPLDSDTLSLYPLYLELQLNANTPMTPRQAISSAPYAQIAGVAESVDGGVVSASEIQIAGAPVIDGTGAWVGPAITVDWADITSTTIPSYITDGDDNTQLSEPQVETYVTNSTLTFAAGSEIGTDGQILGENSILTWVNIDSATIPTGLSDGDDDSLSGLSCMDGEFARWDAILIEWYCASDSLEQLNCSDGEVVTYSTSGGGWVCTSPQSLFDSDGDGVMAWADCDDADPSVTTTTATDADCDGVLTGADCDDNDPLITSGSNGSSANCAAQSCNDILSNDPSASDGMFYIDPDGLGVKVTYCDMTLDDGGWTLVYINKNDSIVAVNTTGEQGTVSNLQSPSGGSAKFADTYINAIKENTNTSIGYRVTSNNISQRYFAPSSCTYLHDSHSSNGPCRQYTATYSASSPSYTQCVYWGGGGGGLDSWYGCNGGGYTNVMNTHRSYTETSGITTNTSGATFGSSSTTHGNDVLMWVR